MSTTVPEDRPPRQGSNNRGGRGRPRLEDGPALSDLESVAGLSRRAQALILGDKVKVKVPFRLDQLTRMQMAIDASGEPKKVSSDRILIADDTGDRVIICPDCRAWTAPTTYDVKTAEGAYRCRNAHSWTTVFVERSKLGPSTRGASLKRSQAAAVNLSGPIREDEKVRYVETLLRHLPPRGADAADEVNHLHALLDNGKQTLKRHARRARELSK